MEVLLLKRSEEARFIPGAYVFPGGAVEEEDARGEFHSAAFGVAALRETFEEAGILLFAEDPGCRSYPNGHGSEGARLRQALRKGETSFRNVMESLGGKLPTDRLTFIGHWVTPVREPYRYDTRFFATEVPTDCEAFPDGTELVESTWLTPDRALALNEEGRLPMVPPTIETLRALSPYLDPEKALRHLGGMKIPRLLPRVEEAGDGVRMILEDPGVCP